MQLAGREAGLSLWSKLYLVGDIVYQVAGDKAEEAVFVEREP
jgi:hypothetical protein